MRYSLYIGSDYHIIEVSKISAGTVIGKVPKHHCILNSSVKRYIGLTVRMCALVYLISTSKFLATSEFSTIIIVCKYILQRWIKKCFQHKKHIDNEARPWVRDRKIHLQKKLIVVVIIFNYCINIYICYHFFFYAPRKGYSESFLQSHHIYDKISNTFRV